MLKLGSNRRIILMFQKPKKLRKKRLRVAYTLFKGILGDPFKIHGISVIFYVTMSWSISRSIP